MSAVLLAIYEFLVASAPLLFAFGKALLEIAAALWELTKIAGVLAVIAAAIELLFDPRGKQRIANLVYNLTAGAVSIATKVLADSAPALEGITAAFADQIRTTAPNIKNTVAKPLGDIARNNLNDADANLAAVGASTPDNALTNAANAIEQAFAFGASSAVVTAMFEALFPEKLNTLNAAGPLFSSMAGFREVIGNALGPLYRSAFGRSLEYKYLAQFSPELPPAVMAAQWVARGIVGQAEYDAIFPFSGQKAEYKDAFQLASYRPIPPFMLVRAAEIGAIPNDKLNNALQFSGFRPDDIQTLLNAYEALALLPYQTSYLAALKRNVELGTNSPQDLTDAMNEFGFSQEQQRYVQLEVATRKLEQLAEIYRKSVSEGYKYGTITDANYVASLEAIGIDTADAQAHYALDSAAKNGKALMQAARAEARLEKERQTVAIRAANESFIRGAIDAAQLAAAYELAGVDPVVAGYAVAFQEYRMMRPLVFVYGLELSRGAALQLKEKVTAIENQMKKQLITSDQASTLLTDLGIPDSNRLALLADWAALMVKPTTTGTKLPI